MYMKGAGKSIKVGAKLLIYLINFLTVAYRFGESTAEATEDVFAMAGHAIGTAWNVFEIRKALNPSSSVSSAFVKNAAK